MKNKTFIVKCSLMLLLTLLMSSNINMYAQNDFPELKQDFPKLLERYGDSLDKRNAHYIFAIDISSSMRLYESTVRESMKSFIDALPNGDQISIIVMADENNTGFLNNYKCRNIDSNTKTNINTALGSLSFLRNGDPRDGSDGFTTTKKIIEAMEVSGSSEMTFIYLLTDFEYWTHRNRFDKSLENWKSLELPDKKKGKGMMCKYGVELSGTNTVSENAIFKSELHQIFGSIDYQSATNVNDLAQWFNQIQNKVREYKMYALLKKDWKSSQRYSIVRNENELKLVIEPNSNEFYKSYGAVAVNDINDNIVRNTDSDCETIGTIEKEKTFLPSYVHFDSTDVEVKITYKSQFIHRDTIQHNDIDEVAILQNQCDTISYLVETRTVGLPAVKIWNSFIPRWAWIAIIILILTIIVSIIWECCQHPELQSLSVDVECNVGNNTKHFKGDTVSLPYSVGMDADLQVPNADWRLVFKGKRYNPIFNFVRRTGCYVTLEAGSFADIINYTTDNKIATLSVGSTKLIVKYKKMPTQRIEIEDGATKYIITIS